MKVEITIDPPLEGDITRDNHDFLTFEVDGPDHLVKWFLTEVSIRDRMVCVYQLEE